MAGCLVFLPYFGPLIGIAIVTIVAFLTFDSLARILLAPAIYIALETIEGQGQGEDPLKGARLNMV